MDPKWPFSSTRDSLALRWVIWYGGGMENPHFQPPVFGIRGVAVQTQDGETFIMPPPHRHHHVLSICGKPIYPEGQGFWSDDDRYLGREDALAYAVARGFDVSAKVGNPELLFSEDLW